MNRQVLVTRLLRPTSEGFVFLSGFSMMVIELLAAKVTAPYLGSSLYTWTSVIGVVLIGVTLGAWAGGRLSDRIRPVVLVAGAFVCSGLSVMLSYGIAWLVGSNIVLLDWPLPLLTFVFAFAVFFPPAVLLAVIQPASVKRDLSNLEKTGTVYGTLGAWNAAGSILGTYLAGFVFQAYLSTRLVWFSIAILLILCGIFIYVRHRLSR